MSAMEGVVVPPGELTFEEKQAKRGFFSRFFFNTVDLVMHPKKMSARDGYIWLVSSFATDAKWAAFTFPLIWPIVKTKWATVILPFAKNIVLAVKALFLAAFAAA